MLENQRGSKQSRSVSERAVMSPAELSKGAYNQDANHNKMMGRRECEAQSSAYEMSEETASSWVESIR